MMVPFIYFELTLYIGIDPKTIPISLFPDLKLSRGYLKIYKVGEKNIVIVFSVPEKEAKDNCIIFISIYTTIYGQY